MRGQGSQGRGAEGVLEYVEAPRPQTDAEIARNDRSPRRIVEAASLGAAWLLLVMVAEIAVVAAFVPRAVLARAFSELEVEAPLLYVATGAALGVLVGRPLLARSRGEARLARPALPHLLGLPPVGISWILGDRDVAGTALVAGVATLGSLFALVPRRRHAAVQGMAAAAGLLALLLVLRVQRPEAPPQGEGGRGLQPGSPDIVLVVLDTLRRDVLSAWSDVDGGAVPTPALERLAAEGARFDQAWAASSWSVPSHASLFSGWMPSRHRATSDSLWLEASVPLLAEELGKRGYRTVALSANPWVSHATGLARGFELAEGAGESVLLEGRLLLYRIAGGPLAGAGDKGARQIVERVPRVLPARDGRPTFLFVNMVEAHAPYHRIPRAARRAGFATGLAGRSTSLRVLEAQQHGVSLGPEHAEAARRSYAAAVRYVDGMLGELASAVDAAAGGRPVLLVVLADHGELFGEHGVWGHGRGLYRPLLQVPMVLRFPGRVRAGMRIVDPVSLVDIAPTLLEAASGRAEALEADGRSLWPLLDGTSTWPRRILFAEQEAPRIEVRGLRAQGRVDEASRIDVARRTAMRDSWRYEVDSRGLEALYDLSQDAGEMVDRSSDPSAAGILAASRADLAAERGGRHAAPVEAPPMPGGTEELLRALGYVE